MNQAVVKYTIWRGDGIHGENEQHMDELVRLAMQLRDCPLMMHRGTRNWPPTWNKISGGSRAGPYDTLSGEIGTLQQVLLSKVEPYNKRCHLLIEYRRMTYVGTLIFDDAMFCRQFCGFLQNHLGKPITEIGDLEIGWFL